MKNKRKKATNNAVKSNRKYPTNVHARDINSKTVFSNPILCAQFLKDNINITSLKNVKPEDIEDVTERYRPFLSTEFVSDTVKRIKIHSEEEPLFLISLIEHKSLVDYDVSMQILKYMMCIWTEYKKEMEKFQKGITRQKRFHYPIIIPIVYYEGKAKWTADTHLKSRISDKDVIGKWIPDFEYEVVRVQDYSNAELLARKNEMSLIMLINKIQDAADLSDFNQISSHDIDIIVKKSPDSIIDILASVIESLCIKIGATEEETLQCVRKVKERNMGYLFENMEKMDIQKERRNTQEAERKAEDAAENGIKILIESFQEIGISREDTLSKIMEKYEFRLKSEAENKLNKYWKN